MPQRKYYKIKHKVKDKEQKTFGRIKSKGNSMAANVFR